MNWPLRANLTVAIRCMIGAGIIFTAMSASGIAFANDLTVSPTSLRVAADIKAATLTVKSGGPGASLGQVRVMRWHRDGGAGRLEATRDVVASPPALQMAPNQELTIRLVRTATRPVRGEECYRVLVDQLPAMRQGGQMVGFTLRHSVPLCFGQPS
jgi:fimbrial chaperone protein